MISTLTDAWRWYEAGADITKWLSHLSKYWAIFPWGGTEEWIQQLQKDNVLRHLEADQLKAKADTIRDWLEDLVVLLLFSVFEANVREWVERQLKPEIEVLRHPTLVKAGIDVMDAVSEGSFFRVLEPYKAAATSDLVEQVNQIRKYRNWVAHGRRPEKKPEAAVTPRETYDRLSKFLELIQGPLPKANNSMNEDII